MSPATHPAATFPWRGYAFLAASMTLVGSYVGFSKWMVTLFPVFLLAWLRFAIAAVAMVGWLHARQGEQPIAAHDARLLFLQSLLGNVLFSVCMLFGVAHTSAVEAGVVLAGLPAAVALLSWLALGEAIALRVAGGIACAVLGIGLLAFARPGAAGDVGAASPWWGQVLLVGALFCEASYVVIGKRLTASVPPRRISALINVWGLALMTPWGLSQAFSFDFAAIHALQWLGLVTYALAASVVTVWLWMRGLREVPAAKAGVVTLFLPLSAAAVGVVFLGEPLTSLHWTAFALALVGLALATWPGSATSP